MQLDKTPNLPGPEFTGLQIYRAREFTGKSAWDAITIANMDSITTRLHWTDQPYKWHVNDGAEIFVVLDGSVEMFFEEDGKKASVMMQVGDVFFASLGTRHVAHPLGEARILVIEKEGSV